MGPASGVTMVCPRLWGYPQMPAGVELSDDSVWLTHASALRGLRHHRACRHQHQHITERPRRWRRGAVVSLFLIRAAFVLWS